MTDFTTIEAALLLKVKPATVTRYIERGLIKAEKRGRDYLISQRNLEQFYTSRKQAGRPPKK